MTQDTGFEGFSDAPAPLGLGDLEVASQTADAAPAPADLGSLGSVTGDAPAPAPLEGEAGSMGEGAPAPVDEPTEEADAGEAVLDAPGPQGGPGDVELGSLQGADPAEAGEPAPMDLQELQALEG